MKERQILNEGQISNDTTIIYEPQILIERQISKLTKITNEPQILKDY